MKQVIRIATLIIFWLSLTTICLSDVTIPAGTKDVLSHQDLNRTNLYRPRSLYLGDAGTHTMLLAAPASLAADTTQFILPSTNGTSGFPLLTDGLGATTWGGTVNLTAGQVSGTAGAGYLEFAHQSSDAGTPGSGSNNVRVIAKSKKLYSVTDNGSGTAVVAELGSGSGGAGELNYISNGSAATDLTGWTVSDASKLNLARTTTTGELPRNTLTPTGIKLYSVASADSTNAYVYYDFVIDSNDAATSRVLKIQWEQKPLAAAPAATDLVVSIVSSADHTTVLATPATTAVPVSATTFYTTFVAPATTTASLKVSTPNNMADNAGIVISNVIVGPGSLVQGAAVGGWTSYSPTLPAGWGTATSSEFYYRRVGDTAQVRGRFLSGTVTANTATIPIPSGLTINMAKFTVSGKSHKVGDFRILSAAAQDPASSYVVFVDTADTANVYLTTKAQTNLYAAYNVNGIFSSGDGPDLYFEVPIAEWSTNVTLGSEATEYSSNGDSDAANATDTDTFVYGPAGSLGITGTPSGSSISRNVRFQRDIQPTDILVLEVSTDRTVWQQLPASGVGSGGSYLEQLGTAGTSVSGAGFHSTKVDAKTIQVTFGKYRNANDDTWVGLSTWYWRVKKVSSPALVGHSVANLTQSVGLLQTGAIPGDTSGVAAAAGYVGEVRTAVVLSGSAVTLSASTYTDLGSIASITAGTYMVSGSVNFDLNGATATGTSDIYISAFSGGTTTDRLLGINHLGFPKTTSDSGSAVLPPLLILSTGSALIINGTSYASTTLYLKARHTASSGQLKANGAMHLVRIR